MLPSWITDAVSRRCINGEFSLLLSGCARLEWPLSQCMDVQAEASDWAWVAGALSPVL